INPGATEVPYNGIDEDCSAVEIFKYNMEHGLAGQDALPDPHPDDDLDHDGYTRDEDCDDLNPDVNPAAVEVGSLASDGIDNNCNGKTDEEWKDLPDGSFVFIADPDQEHIDSGKSAGLQTYFYMGSKWQALTGTNNLPMLDNPDTGKDLMPAGLIYFTSSGDNLQILGQPKTTDSLGNLVYPGDYRIAKFTSPGGEYTSYLQAPLSKGKYSGQESGTPGKLEFDLHTAEADTQYAGINIPFPYSPLGTEAYTNKNGEVHSGVRAQYLGTSADIDINGDGTKDGKFDYWSVTLAAAGNVPNTVPGFADAPFGHVMKGWIVYLGPKKNAPPTADAGPDQEVEVGTAGTTVTLDGTGSTDPEDGTPAVYSWSLVKKPLGSRTVILNPGDPSVDVTLDKIGFYAFQLSVKDSQGAVSPNDEVSVIAFAKTSLTESIDSDRDGIPDDQELGTESANPDSDGDGTLDGEDVADGSSPVTVDSDNDGITDGLDYFPVNSDLSFVTESHTQVMTNIESVLGEKVRVQVGKTTGKNRENGEISTLSNQADMSYFKIVDPSDPSLSGVDLPDGALVLAYNIEYNLNTFAPGASVAVTIDVPSGISSPAVFKVVGGVLQRFPARVDMAGSGTIMFNVTDGGAGDEDGTANGIIVDPIVLGQAGTGADVVNVSSSGGGSGGGCAVSAQPDAADVLLLLLPLFALAGTRWARKRLNK
ncbi:MAG: hypothetical protein GXP58_11915, partial [Deltaproteobacteria bacterium]|nr:hypothetical protein [Deltaproteobacteria bacterium]